MRIICNIFFILFFTKCIIAQVNLDSALLEASYNNNREEILELIRKGANVNTKTTDGVTPLMYATQNNAWNIVKILVFNGADVNILPENGRSALITAVLNNNLDIADYLVQHGADLNNKDYYSISPIIYAAAYGFYYITDMLLYYGADIKITANDGTNAIIIASMNGHTLTDSLLLSKGADINSADNLGFTSLMVACQSGFKETVEFLLKNGADASMKNKFGNDALMIAIQNNHFEISELLLKHKTDSIKISKQKLMFKYAYTNNNRKLVKTLRYYNLKPGFLPVYNSIHYGFTNFFNHHHDMLGGIIGIYDCKYKTSIDYSFYSRLGSRRILVETAPDVYYQFWERRSLMALTLQKDFLFYNKKIVQAIFVGFREAYTYGKYRGSSTKPEKIFIHIPQLGYHLSGKIVALKLNYEYVEFKTFKVSPHHLNFEFLININTFRPVRNNKTISSWLKVS